MKRSFDFVGKFMPFTLDYLWFLTSLGDKQTEAENCNFIKHRVLNNYNIKGKKSVKNNYSYFNLEVSTQHKKA